MLIAVRTVSETDDFHIIDGLAFPFLGRDTYNTFFSARTNYHWDLFPDLVPSATRSESEPLYIRPVTYHHGFDAEFGLDRLGGWSPVRMDSDGVWVQAQIDKRKAYYATRIRPLLEANALGLSGGSAEHSVRIDDRTHEILEWPAYELALTPVESNPLASIGARADTTFRIVLGLKDDAVKDDTVIPDGTPLRAAIQMVRSSATDAATGYGILGSLMWLIEEEDGEPDQVAMLQSAADQVTTWIDAERAEITEDQEAADAGNTFLSGIRAGARNSAGDAASLTTAHDSIASVLGMDCAPGDSSARSAEGPPELRLIAQPEQPNATLDAMATRAAQEAATAAVRRLTGRDLPSPPSE